MAKNDSIQLQLTIRKVVWTADGENFGIAKVALAKEQADNGLPVEQGGEFSLLGPVLNLGRKDTVEAYGYFQESKKGYGWEFKAKTIVKVVGNNLAAMHAFLAKLPQVGSQRARAIMRHVANVDGTTPLSEEAQKEAMAKVMDYIKSNPAGLTAVRGITMERAQAIHKAFEEAYDLRESAMFLAGLRLSEDLQARILEEWGEHAKRLFEQDPYQLMDLRGIGFRTADEIALTKLQINPHDPRRAAAAVLHLLQEEESGFDGGHTWTDLRELVGFKPDPRI
jgi:hypothetical protein